MQYFFIVVLTTLSFACIIIINNVLSKKRSKIVYHQSDMHNMLKYFFNIEINNNKSNSSQLKNRKEKEQTKVIILDNKAYWVLDNVFYVSNTIDGEVRPETGIPVDTSTLSPTDINKLLFILDALKGGKSNDSGSTRNE